MKVTSQIILFLMLPIVIQAQQISGTVTDKMGPILGATVSISSSNGTITDMNGNYELKVPAGSHELKISFVGYTTKKMTVAVASGESKKLDVTLEENSELLSELVVVGTRSRPRSSIDTAVPVDILSADDLISSGQNSFDKALTYRVPSFNSVQTPVNDATSLLDPYEIRNMGPSRTLILINGKRKNLSALLYTQTSPGRGETGSDISGIPTDAIKRVEILRDGASAQYGSDAIAGVMNIILKDDAEYGSVTLRGGITGEGDGETVGISLNNGSSLGENGFINYTVDFSSIGLSNRPGTVDAEGEAIDFGADLAVVEEFLARNPDANNINGSPEKTAAKFLVNGGFDVSESTSMYFNAAYVYKNVNSYANYRTPYWRTVEDFPYLADFFPAPGTPNNYDGYVPTFDGLLNDYNATVGFKSEKNDWLFDASFTTGGNTQTYKVSNSHNRNEVYSPSTWLDTNGDGVVDDGEVTEGSLLYQENSPISFDPGGTRFTHNVGNLDISRPITDNIGFAIGTEFRTETFTVIEGELASYDGGGADSFAGNTPENSGSWNRYNFGGYVDLSWDVSNAFLVNGTARVEKYSDFGNAFVWKVSSRYKLIDDKLTFRGSLSTGFRAPTLHQIFTQKAQYSFVPGQGIQVGGLVNNVSPQAKLLGIDELDAEKSINLTLGVGGRLSENFNFTVDYYDIKVKDRIVLSTEVTPPAEDAFALFSDLSFFTNAIDTKTSGVDVVLNYKDVAIGKGTLGVTLSGNYTIQNERDGDVKNPDFVTDQEQSVVNETQEALFFTSRPKTKWILGVNYDIGKFGFSLNNTLFGKTEFVQQGLTTHTVENPIAGAANPYVVHDVGTEFKPKVVTDLGINYAATDKINISFNINNLFNVLPEWEFVALTDEGEAVLADEAEVKSLSNLITFNQRYSQMTYDGYHFSQLGSIYNLTVNVRF